MAPCNRRKHKSPQEQRKKEQAAAEAARKKQEKNEEQSLGRTRMKPMSEPSVEPGEPVEIMLEIGWNWLNHWSL